jgi:purine-binding chemotaxis protein CheW
MPETCVRVRVGAEEYALPVRHVPEVADLGELTPVPGAPERVLGICNLRGEVLAVFDMATAMGTGTSGTPSKIVLADVGGLRCGLAVDAVLQVIEFPEPEEAVESPLMLGASLVEGTLIGMVDVPALLEAIVPGAAP